MICPEYDDANTLNLNNNQDHCDGRCQKHAKEKRRVARLEAEHEVMVRQVVYGPDHFRKEHFPDQETAQAAADKKAAGQSRWKRMYPYECQYPGCGQYGLTTHTHKPPRLRGERAPR